MSQYLGSPTDDVVPPVVNHLLGISWVILFAGRWVVVQLLLAAGMLSSAMVSELDDRVLLRCYLALLSATILVVALRTMRGSGRKPANRVQQKSSDGPSAEGDGSVSMDAADREANSRD